MSPELVTYIVTAIEQGASNQEIITDLTNQGISPDVVAEGFVEAYNVLGITGQADQALGAIVRPEYAEPIQLSPIERILQNDSKTIGLVLMGGGLIFLLLISYFLVGQLQTGGISTGDTLSHIEPVPQTTPTQPDSPSRQIESIFDVSRQDTVEPEATPQMQDIPNANPEDSIGDVQFIDEMLPANYARCFGNAFPIAWDTTPDVEEVLLGVYQPGFGEAEVYTIGTYPAVLNSTDEYSGSVLWLAGTLRGGERLDPGTGYRLVIQEVGGQARDESGPFSLANCGSVEGP